MAVLTMQEYPFVSAFGEFLLNAEVELQAEAYTQYLQSRIIETIPHKLLNQKSLLRQAAAKYFALSYWDIVWGRDEIDVAKLLAITNVLSLNWTQFAIILGVDKGSISNIFHGRRRMMRPTQLLVLERLAMELVRPGAALGLIKRQSPSPPIKAMQELIDKVRFMKIENFD